MTRPSICTTLNSFVSRLLCMCVSGVSSNLLLCLPVRPAHTIKTKVSPLLQSTVVLCKCVKLQGLTLSLSVSLTQNTSLFYYIVSDIHPPLIFNGLQLLPVSITMALPPLGPPRLHCQYRLS